MAAIKKSGLGSRGTNTAKGLVALFDDAKNENTNTPVIEQYVPIDKIEPNKEQPRKEFEEDDLNNLADNIEKKGIINPLIVRKKEGKQGEYYEIVAGERRWRASKMVGLKELPVIVRDLSDQDAAEIALIDNIQRTDLNPIEEALAFKLLIDKFGLKQDEVADTVSKSRVYVTNSMRLLKLEEKVRRMIIDGMLSAGHGRVILSLPQEVNQIEVAEDIFDKKMSVREAEAYVKKFKQENKNSKKEKKTNAQLEAIYGEIEERLKNTLGSKVRINDKNNNKGVIEIEYYSKEQLESIIEKLEA